MVDDDVNSSLFRLTVMMKVVVTMATVHIHHLSTLYELCNEGEDQQLGDYYYFCVIYKKNTSECDNVVKLEQLCPGDPCHLALSGCVAPVGPFTLHPCNILIPPRSRTRVLQNKEISFNNKEVTLRYVCSFSLPCERKKNRKEKVLCKM